MASITQAKSTSNLDQTRIITYAIGGAILYFGVLRPILKKTGIVSDEKEMKLEEKIQENRAADQGNPWNPFYYTKSKDPSWLNWKAASALSAQIYDAKAPSSKNWFTDDENAAIAAFNGLTTKKQLSILAFNFQKLYTKDLYNYLESFLSNSDLAAVNGKVKNLK
jgi:hypothetical protein